MISREGTYTLIYWMLGIIGAIVVIDGIVDFIQFMPSRDVADVAIAAGAVGYLIRKWFGRER